MACHKPFFKAPLQRCHRAAAHAGRWLWALCALWAWPLAAQTVDFQPVFDTHSAVMLLIEPASGQIVDANAAAVGFYGLARETLQQMRIQQINTLSEEQVAQERERATQEERHYFIFRHALSNGDIRTVEVYSSPLQWGAKRLLLSVVHDITPGRNLEQGLWNYQTQLEDMVGRRTAELRLRNQWVLAALLLVSVFALALVWARYRRKQIEDALAYRQGLFSAMFESSGLLSGIVNPAGQLCEVNQRALQWIELPAEAVIGQDFANTPWWQAEDRPRLRQALERAAQGQADRFEATHRSPTGKTIWVQFHAVPVRVENQLYTSVIGVDISEMKRLAALETHNNRLLSAVFDHAEVGLALVSPTGQLLKVNEQFAAIVGYSRHEMLVDGFDIQQLSHADDQAVDATHIQTLLAGASDSYTLEKRYIHKHGHDVWANVSVRLVRDENHRPDYLVSAITDISRRKAAELHLQQAKTGLERSEALLRRVIDAMPHIVMVKDAQGHFQLVNTALADLYQSTPAAMQGKDDGAFNANPEQVAFYRRNIQEIIESGQAQRLQEDSTDAATGETRHYQSVKVPFAGADGAPSVLVVSTDITELYQTQKRLRLSEERMAFNLAATRDGLWDWWILEDRVDHNEQWGCILGLTDVPNSHPVSFFTQCIHPDDRAMVMARIDHALNSDGPYESEHRAVWPDGRIVWLLDRGRVVARHAQGQPLRMVGSVRDITESKQAQVALMAAKQAAENSLERLREAEQIASMGNWMFDLQTSQLEWSEQAYRMAGLPQGGPIDLGQFMALVHPEDRPVIAKAWSRAVQCGGRYEVEHRVGVGAPWHWVREIADLSRINNGKVVGTVLNITRQRELEDQMQVQRRRLQSILDGTDVGTWEWNVQTGATVFNDRWAEMVGYSLAELAPVSIATWQQLAHPDDLQRSGELLRQHFVDGHSFYDFESRMRHRDGHWIWVHDRGKVATWTEDGLPLLMAGTHQDITVRKEAEQALKEAQARLQQSEHLLMDTEQLALVGGWVYQVESAQMYWTPGLFQLHGLVPSPGFDHISASLTCYHASDRQTIAQAFAACIEELKPYDLVFPFRNHSGQERWIRTKTKPVLEAGKLSKVLGIVMDITEQKQTEATLQAAVETARQLAVGAEAANIAKSRFLATMSHELRTPLNGVLGMAQLLLVAPPDENKFRDYARTILNSGQALLNLLNDILDLSKVEAGRVTLELVPVMPHELLADTRTLFAFNAESKGLSLQAHWAGAADQRYQGDAHRLRQMLSNLVSNAIKFTHQGAICLDAREIATEGPAALLEFSVRDTGIGIERSQLPQLFQPFKQIDDSTSRHFGGTGLGLSIVKSLAKQMGGEVGVESVQGQGSRFWFRVRLQRLASAAPTASTSLPAQRPSTAAPSPAALPQRLQGRVLVVEDEPTNQTVIVAMLSNLGVDTLLASDGHQALQWVTQPTEGIDAILMDIHMPGWDGFETTARIRAWEAECGRAPVPIVALTASAFGEDRAHCLRAGMDFFLTKPVHLDSLAQTLARWLHSATAPVPLASTAPTAVAPDWPEVQGRVEALLPLLAAAKFSAIAHFQQLQEQVQGSPLAAELAAIAPDMDAFRFEAARTALLQFLDTHTPLDCSP